MSDNRTTETLKSDGSDRVPAAQVGPLRAVWNRWGQMARALGVVQTRFLLVGFFVVIVFPTGLFVRATGDRLRIKPPKGSNWVELEDKKQDLDAARRQF